MSKELTIKVTDKQYDYFKRIARSEDRKLDDLVRLIFIEGIYHNWSEDTYSFKKKDDEYTPKEQDQIIKNKELEKTEGWDDLDYKEKAKRGYDSVSEWHSGGGYSDSKTNFSYKLSEELRLPLIDQEVE